MFSISTCICRFPIHSNQVLRRECRCDWSSADTPCSNFIWVSNRFLSCIVTASIKGLTVHANSCENGLPDQNVYGHNWIIMTFSLDFTNRVNVPRISWYIECYKFSCIRLTSIWRIKSSLQEDIYDLIQQKHTSTANAVEYHLMNLPSNI